MCRYLCWRDPSWRIPTTLGPHLCTNTRWCRAVATRHSAIAKNAFSSPALLVFTYPILRYPLLPLLTICSINPSRKKPLRTYPASSLWKLLEEVSFLEKRKSKLSTAQSLRTSVDGNGIDAAEDSPKKKTAGKMFMTAVEIPIRPSGPTFSKNPPTTTSRQLSMRNYFSSSPSSNLVVVPSKGKNTSKSSQNTSKSSQNTSKSSQKTSTLNTFVVRSPQKPPAPQPVSKPRSRSRSLNNSSKMVIDLDSDKDDESDFAPPSEAPSDGEASVAESAVPTDDEIDPKEEESSESELIFAKGSSSKTAKVTAKKNSGAAYKHHSAPKNCGLTIKPREGDLPPISDLQSIFDDIVSRIPAVTGLFGDRGGRKLRVATMCSGTESPLLALGLFGRSFQKMELGKLEIQHVFSCEIEPYKQAYIERNFKPPILFRDIRELGQDFATTAYGAKVAVPGNVDLLVAGTSCVDFSNLNNKKKTLDDVGESSDTFHGMMRWVNRHRPTIIIHENVAGAAWTEMRAEYLEAGYSAEFLTSFDTKNYYIPQTRCRGYLFAIDQKGSSIPNKWIDAMRKLRRPASCTLEAFLLQSDDPRIHQVRMDLAAKRDANNKPSRSVEWEKCEGKHQKERIVQKLGLKRPMTHWEEGGISKMFDFAWQDWGHSQVDRVLDLMDINLLTQAKAGIDANYKEQFWNLSQNVDRNTFGKANGICPCLTPHMIPFLTFRGGPMIGLESLAMQGLPINELLLTRETSQELQNLAGNAMSSTVVGTAILAALILSQDHLRLADDDDMDIDVEEVDISTRISGVGKLVERPLDLSTSQQLKIKTLLKEAQRSARLCVCEGRSDITSNKISVCKECGHTSCEKCGGRPEHHYIPFKYTDDRITPLQFEHKVKSVLPMRLLVDGISSNLLDDLKHSNPDIAAKIKSSDWKTFQDCLTYAVKSEFRFMSLKRQEIWSANYDAPEARIELLLDPLQPEWRLFAKCPATDGALSFRRKMCEMPLARMRLAGASDPMEGQWEICLPARYEFNLEIEGKGSLVESWEASIGLQDPKFADKKVWDHIQISVPDDMKHCLDQNINGTYQLLPTCGTANGSLHKKVDQDGALPIYFFLDPTKTAEAKSDPFVFSTTTRRYAYGEKRPLVARMETKFRPSSAKGPRTFECFADGQWVSTDEVTLATPVGKKGMINEGVFSIPGPQGLSVSVSNDDCKTANAVLTCRVPLKNQAEEIWTEGVWTEVDRIHERNTFESLAWLTERIRSMEQLSKWNNLNLPSDYSNCERCAPTAPSLKWVRKGNKYVPREDSEQAAPYERALKNRPSPFVTQLKLERSSNGDKVGLLKIGLNIPTLVHRALSRLPYAENAIPMLSWRLTTDYIPVSKLVLPPFELTSNKRDAQFTQPPNFITKLRPEQLRSLTWMMEQEKDEAPPFIEEEVSEALLPHLNWKAEGRAERPVQVLGGVLADQVGYGKTAITLGLIDCSHTSITLPSKIPGMIPVKATLIVVPPHLTNQWPSEIAKFTGNTYKVIKLKSHTDLNKTSIQQIMNADIIVVSSTLFKSDAYLSSLATFSASNSPPGSDGRRFNAWQDQALTDLKEQVEDLCNGGADFVLARMEEQSKKLKSEDVGEVFVQTKRLIGKAYVEAKEKGKAGAKRKRPDTDQDSDSNESSSSVSGRTKKSKVSVARTEGDPWKLKSSLVKRDWKQMMAPPLAMFHFNRLVIDEYTYLGGRIHSSITCLKSKFRWILSGTPPLDDFADVKTISVFLGIHLGIDDDMVGKIDNRKKIKKDRTDVEAFTAFRELRSPNWHQRRQEVAQAFLNQFVRQNIAEIDEIPFEEHAVPVSLPAAERAIYLELEHHLQALDMNIRRSKIKLDNDRDKRLQESLGDSASAEEALLKRCSHFVLDFTKEDEENAVQACQVIVKDRKRQLTSCREEVLQRLVDCLKRHKEIPKSSFPGEDHFNTWLTTTRTAGIGDAEAGKDILALIDQAYGNGKGPAPFADIGNVPKVNYLSKSKKTAKGKKEDDDVIPWPTSMEDKIQQLRDRTSQLRALVRKELVGRHRSLRYFKIVRDLQQFGLAEFAKRNSISNISCPGCGRSGLPVSEIAVLSSCGHQGCYTCLETAAHRQECLTAGCDAPARVLNVVKGDSLGVEDPKEGLGKHYGMKLEKVMELIKETIPKKDKVLLFVQFPDLMEKVAEVLSEYKINFLQLKGSAAAQSKALQRFQEAGDNDSLKVLLLNVMDESASGANLTNANHAIFLSPLLTTSDYEYRSCETQAIGRVRRYGQQKKVHVWRFLTENTIDITIFEQRSGLKFKDYPQYKI